MGVMEGKEMVREMLGVKVEGMMGEGRREAERRDWISERDILE